MSVSSWTVGARTVQSARRTVCILTAYMRIRFRVVDPSLRSLHIQDRFLDIELADDLRHDYLDSMDAESRNKILCANEKVLISCLS